MAALEAERVIAVAVGVELDAEGRQGLHGRGRLVTQHPGGGLADAPPSGRDRVLEMALRGVVGGQRRGEPALGPVAR